ncbi:MAG: NAD-dependent epimerase/dehydratase family protein [bacterium]
MDISGNKILVIGGAGLIGSHVVDELVKEELEFKATTPLKEGLKRLIEWRQKHKKSGY